MNPNDGSISMISDNMQIKPVVGFSIAYGLSEAAKSQWQTSHEKVLAKFPWLQVESHTYGGAHLFLWGHWPVRLAMTQDVNQNLWVLIGSPFGKHGWHTVFDNLVKNGEDRLHIPWEGRCVLLRVSPDGKLWSVWNDWAGSVPIYHSSWQEGGVASCLESVVVSVADLNASCISKRGLVELLLLGQFLGTDTLYTPMQVIAPDSHVSWRRGKVGTSNRLWTVKASDEHFSTPRPILIEKLHDLTRTAVSEALVDEDSVILFPLSSGMDSRLTAAVVADLHLEVEAYSYGPKEWLEVLFAKQLAEVLDIPWQRVDLGLNYRADFTRDWLNWFGSSLHAHGMYQFPFLRRIQGRGGIVPNGFYGNNMAGGDHPNDCLFETGKNLLDRFCGYSTYWTKDMLPDLLDFDPAPYYSEMNDILQAQVASVSNWPEYQQMNVIDMWNRQARFIFYQPMVYGYFGHERSPFMHRDYARFCQSLPPDLLKKRKLQVEMLDKYWPSLGKVGGTFRPMRGVDRIWHSTRYHIAKRLPRTLRPLMGATWLNKSDSDCAFARKWDNLFPVSPDLPDLAPLRARPILEAAQRANAGNIIDLARIAAVQPVLARLMHVV